MVLVTKKVLEDKLVCDNFKEFFYFLLYAEAYQSDEDIKRFDGTKVIVSELNVEGIKSFFSANLQVID